MPQDKIIIKGARENNLKNISLEIPREKLVVLTGLSGSGKTSLAFDTIYAEGQRRYVESLSSYARQFLGQMEKPDVDGIDGLSPAISIDQKTTSKNPRSTVGTVTEIHDYLRLLYARAGIPHCPVCGKEISQQTIDQIVDKVCRLDEGTKFQILAPIVRARKGEHRKVFDDAKRSGYARVRVDGILYDLLEEINLEKNKKHSIDIVIDRLVMKENITARLTESIETALSLTDGLVVIDVIGGEEMMFSQSYSCEEHDISIEELLPRMFSFNNPHGACSECSGLGMSMKIDVDKLIPNKNLSLNQGAIKAGGWNLTKDNNFAHAYISALSEKYKFSMDVPVKELPKKALDLILYGTGDEKHTINYNNGNKSETFTNTFEGIIPNLERRYANAGMGNYSRYEIEHYMTAIPCDKCHGARLNPISLAVTVGDKNIDEVCKMSITEAYDFFDNIKLSEKQQVIAKQILKELRERLGFLKSVGLEYLTLSRSAGTLSGGEAQRIRLATQIGSSLMGVLYILDEPSIGLHQRDNERLIATLKRLRDLGNTLLVVEHDEDTMLESDYIIDIGPGAGIHGGEVMFAGTPEQILKDKKSITGQYLSGQKFIPIPEKRRAGNGNFIEIKSAAENNLKNVDVKIPLGTFTCVTGVSGSGKSTLVNEILYKSLAKQINKSFTRPGKHKEILGLEHIDKVIDIDQSPIGRTPRSNPATYTGVFTDIRNTFAMATQSKMRGYGPGRFSFNVKGGRCEACEGDGIIKIEMHFLADVYVPCEVCKGKRYNRETLEVKYKDKNIYDVLEMSVEEGVKFFENIPKIRRKLQTLVDVGLSYIKIGQSSTTLSGGEAQRVKLATELSKIQTGRTVYILDEPTTGLHTADVHKLIDVLQKLVDAGNTVIVIEHNLDVIKVSDYIIDLGPEGGDKGGEIVTCGTPEEVAVCDKSYTGKFLKKYLNKNNMD